MGLAEFDLLEGTADETVKNLNCAKRRQGFEKNTTQLNGETRQAASEAW
jgi:hypothetical protein